jgi:hypothetical protein
VNTSARVPEVFFMTLQQLNDHYTALKKAHEARAIYDNLKEKLQDHSSSCLLGSVDYILTEQENDVQILEASAAESEAIVYAYVRSVPDPLIRDILCFRFLCGCTWEETAFEIGGGNTCSSVKMACYRYMKKAER